MMTIAVAQDRGEWRKTGGTRGGKFRGEIECYAKKARAGLRHGVVCQDVTGKDHGEDSSKQSCSSCWFARHN